MITHAHKRFSNPAINQFIHFVLKAIRRSTILAGNYIYSVVLRVRFTERLYIEVCVFIIPHDNIITLILENAVHCVLCQNTTLESPIVNLNIDDILNFGHNSLPCSLQTSCEYCLQSYHLAKFLIKGSIQTTCTCI
jgi:hypothetical protein